MTREEVFSTLNEVFRDVFDDESITVNDATTSADIEEWDSMAIMAAIAYFDVTHGKQLTFEDFSRANVVADIAGMIPGFEK